MNDFSFYNSNFPGFIKELFRLAWGLVKGIKTGLVYLWRPACDTCELKRTECLANSEPCTIQKIQKDRRLAILVVLFVVLPLIWSIWNSSDSKTKKLNSLEQKVQTLEQKQ